ncbi:MAG: NUDIX domain-containing protein, partial [Chromatiales bacterium]
MPADTYKRPESVLVVVYTAGGEVLLLRRTRPRDFWQSVTGSLHWGESPRQAARR